jgi:hypothetical protein
MFVIEPAFNRDGHDVLYGRYRTGRFWHTVRDDDGRAVEFKTEAEAMEALRTEWWAHTMLIRLSHTNAESH